MTNPVGGGGNASGAGPTDLTQAEADALLAMEKKAADAAVYSFPGMGGRLTVPLLSLDQREEFTLDIGRGRIDLAKVTMQNRARRVVVLARLDLGSAPHTNPDGTTVGSPHLHLYRPGFADKWASAVPADRFANLPDPWATLQDFMAYCNVTDRPDFQNRMLP